MERRQLLSALEVTNTNDDINPNSLRWAILQANSGTGGATIDFDIPGPGPVTITLGTPLPALVNPVVIDGTSEPGYQGSPLIEIDGAGMGAGNNGLVISGGSSTVQGLSIVGFSNAAIVLTSGSSNVIEGNYLGVAPSGTQAIPNGQGLSVIGSSNNTIGNGGGGAGNVISGNTENGILIQAGATVATGNLISGNLIGTAANGTTALGNSLNGIAIVGASDNVIGAAEPFYATSSRGTWARGSACRPGRRGRRSQATPLAWPVTVRRRSAMAATGSTSTTLPVP